MDTESKIFEAPDTNGVIKTSWQHLLLATLAIVVINNSIYLLCKSIESIPFLVNTIYLIGAAGCQALLTGSALYRYEQAKIILTTDRRKASLFGVVFRENFKFQKTYDALGGTPAVLKGIVLLSLGLTLIAYGDFTGLQFSTGILGLLIVFCLLADWLWMPILLSGTFMVIAAHQSFGAQDIKTFFAVALFGLECLCFAWFIGNRMESIRINSVRAGDKQNRTQITLLALTFLVIASTIFMILPKKIDIRTNSNKLSQVINRQFDKASERRQESRPRNNKGRGPQSKTQGNQKRQPSGQQPASQQPTQQSDGSPSDLPDLPNLPEQGGSGKDPDENTGQNNFGDTESRKGNQPDPSGKNNDTKMGTNDPEAAQTSQNSEKNDQKDSEENEVNDSNQKSSSANKSPESALKKTSGKSPKDLSKTNAGNRNGNGNGTGNGTEKDSPGSPSKNENSVSGANQSSTASSQPKHANQKSGKLLPEEPNKTTKTKQPKKALPKLNKKTIIIVLLVLMLVILIVVLIKALKKTKKKNPIEKTVPDLPTQAEISAAMRKFRQDYQRLMSTPESSDADRRARMIALYNMLLLHYESCGLAKPEYFTPDDFDRFEFIYRAPGKKALAFITSSFNRAYYGLKTPAQQEYQNYCQSIAELGIMLAKMAPRAP